MLRLGIDDLDEGYFVEQGARVLHGQVPFRDFETLYTPGLAYVHAAVFALTGGPSLLAPRAIAVAARAALAFAMYTLARPHVRNRWWAAAPALVLLLGLDDAPVRWEPHPGWLSALFAVLAVWCLTRPTGHRWLIFSGIAAAASYAFKQNTGVFILAAILLWTTRGQFFVPPVSATRTRLLWPLPLAAFIATTLVWLVPLALAVRDMTRLAPLVGAVNQASLFSAPEPALLVPLAALLGGVWLVRRDSHPDLRLYLLTGVALFLTEFPRMDSLHLMWSAPLLLVVGAVVLGRVAVPVAVASLITVATLVAPTWTSRIAFLTLPRTDVAGVQAPEQTASAIAATVSDIQGLTAPGDPIFVYPTSPLLYVLADRPNPTRFDHLNPGAANASQIEQVIADLERARISTVVVSDFWQSVWGPPGPNAPLEEWLAQHTREVARHGSYRVLVTDL